MKVTSTGIANGYWEDRFGKFGTELSAEGTPLRSIPFKIEDAPEGTVSFAVVLDDVDAIPVCGFTWIHWALCDLTVTELPEDASRHDPSLIQGCTSFHSVASDESIEEASRYGGMAPPDKEHQYDLSVYALDCKLNLKPSFYLNELIHGLRGHVLSHTRLSAMYRAK